MKIDLVKLASGKSIELKQSYEPQSLDLELPQAEFKGPAEVSISAQKKNNTLIVKGDIKLELLLACSRCLKKFSSGLDHKIEFVYQLKGDETSVDITDELREEIIIGFPVNPLCSPICKGLCVNCGEDLNDGDCRCKAL